jgi:hypothetical protein
MSAYNFPIIKKNITLYPPQTQPENAYTPEKWIVLIINELHPKTQN